MSILISTDLQLLAHIHVWNIDKNLFFIIAFILIYRKIYNINNVGNSMYSCGNTEITLLTEPQVYFLDRGYLSVVTMLEIKMEIVTRLRAVTNGWGWGLISG